MLQEIKRVDKPWGCELIFAKTDRYCGKIIVVRKDQSLSLQYHNTKEETMYMLSGNIMFTKDDSEFNVYPGQAVHIAPGTKHKVYAIEDSTIFEVSTSEIDDVVRLKDQYGREGTTAP